MSDEARRIEDIDGTRNVVMYYIGNYERLRDSDEKLVATIWRLELKKQGIDTNEISGFIFLSLFAAANKLTNYEEIVNHKRDIQKNIKELRGINYKED